MLNEIWGMRYNIIFAVQNYRDKFLSFLKKGDLPETQTMGFYRRDKRNTTLGKRKFQEDHQARHLVKMA